MRRASLLIVVLGFITVLPGQRSASTTLVVRVEPEAYLNPTQAPLAFRVSSDGTANVISQTTTIDAWVRALPGQQIWLTAKVANLSGPQGAVPASAVAWSGSAIQATAGAQQAACTSGTFTGGAAQNLAAGWQRSGTLRCAVTFSLADAPNLAPGTYTGTVLLMLSAQ